VIGEITGTEPLFIDGAVEGTIYLPDHRVTIGRNGHVTATVTARDIVVLGEIWGDVTATNLLEILAEGAVTGNVVASRLSIEEGAFFKGGIEIVHEQAVQAAEPALAAEAVLTADTTENAWTRKRSQPEVGNLRIHPVPMSA
jgi:cytoskeletal protein CcmA (bactofilin family)